jgi:hypothetical protein
VTAWARIALGAREPSLSLIVVTEEEVRFTRHKALIWPDQMHAWGRRFGPDVTEDKDRSAQHETVMRPKKTHVSSVVAFLTRMSWSLRKHIKDNGFGTSCVQGGSVVPLHLNASRGSFVRTRREDSVTGWSQHSS